MFWQKKWGILIKEESLSLDFPGSKIPRDYYCGMEREKVNIEVVSWFQENPFAYTTVIAAFAEYVGCNWDVIVSDIKSRFNLERKMVAEVVTERRLIDSAVVLRIANALISQSVSQEEEPSITFIKTIDNLMRIKEIQLTDKNTLVRTSTYDGFEDADYYYFNPQNTHRKVVKYLMLSNNYYPLDLRETLAALGDGKLIHKARNGEGKHTYCVRVHIGEGKKQSFIKISKSVFNSVIEEYRD